MALRRIWDWIFQPSIRWGTGVLLVAGGIGGVILWGGFHTAMESTNTLEFCISCHEMKDNAYTDYTESAHFNNPSGVRAICTDCHVPHEWGPYVIAKVRATKDVYYHLTGKISTPEKYEEHRAAMAKSVWARMEASDSRECRNCHSYESMDFEHQDPEAAKQMQAGMEAGDTCITCHKGVAHKMPDLSGGYKLMYEELQAQAASEGAKADRVYALSEIPFWLEQGQVGEGKGEGLILSATGMDVLDRTKDALNVRIEGWRQEGADRVMYEMQGQRIFTATFRPAAVEQIVAGEAQVDPDTDLTWLPVSIEGWVARTELIADRADLWDYAEEMYSASCATCHGRPDPHHFLANQWIGVMKSMERFISLDKREYRFLQKYLQLNASDTSDVGH